LRSAAAVSAAVAARGLKPPLTAITQPRAARRASVCSLTLINIEFSPGRNALQDFVRWRWKARR